jgi:hypothetical protein
VALSRVPSVAICALAVRQAALAAALASHTLVSWSQTRFVMMLGFSASSWPLPASLSMSWKVNSLAGRPSRPPSNLMVGTQRPKSRPGMVLFWTEEVAPAEELAGLGAGVGGPAFPARLR